MRFQLTLTATVLLLAQAPHLFAQGTAAPPAPAAAPDAASAPPVAAEAAPAPAPAPVAAPPAPPPPLPPADVAPLPPPAPPPPPKVGNDPLASGPQPVMGKWGTTLYGFVEFDAIHDSTQPGAVTTINDTFSNATIARPGTYQASNGQTLFAARNSRIGFKLNAPESDGIKASAVIEMDFLGNQPTTGGTAASPSNTSQGALITNALFRTRHMALKIENPIVDVLLGQTWGLFGWQGAFHPNSVQIQGLPGEVFGRTTQARLTKSIKSDAVNFDIAIAASRPPQRNAELPDGQAGLKLTFNGWKGIHTAGSASTSVDGLAIGVSGTARRFVLPSLSGVQQSKRNGTGLSIDALLPVVPATMDNRSNGLTLTGSFVTGTGISDLYTGLNGGVGFPAPPNPNMTMPAPTYVPDVDSGMITFDGTGHAHTIDWQSWIVGIQYYLPPSGKVWISANYSGMKSDNAASYVADTTAAKGKIFTKSYFLDANLFADLTSAVRLGAEYAFMHQTYADGVAAKNTRLQFSGFYLF